MRLQRLRIEQVRQFRTPMALAELRPGINLIHGPNESGKSTLVRAIRAAFFERHRSKSVDDLRPWGDSAAAPTIELDFEHDGHQWQLTKSFLQRKRCDLVIDGNSFAGEEAEEKLAELLGFQLPKKGVSKAEHWGIPGLLWVEQGTGQDIEAAVEHAGDHLKSALNNLVGEVASSGGDDVIQAVEKQRAELLTATGKPRGEYQQLAAERDERQGEIADLATRIEHYRSQVDRLGVLSAEFDRANSERPWEDALRRMEQALEQFRQVESLQQQQLREQESLSQLRQNLDLLRQNQAQMQAQGAKLKQREAELQAARERLAGEEARTPGLDKAVKAARADYEAAAGVVEQARQQEVRTRLQQEVARLEEQYQTLRQNLDKASGFQQQLDQGRQQKQENRIDAELVLRARTTRRQLEEEMIRSQAIATRLSWQLEPGRSLQLNERTLEGKVSFVFSTRVCCRSPVSDAWLLHPAVKTSPVPGEPWRVWNRRSPNTSVPLVFLMLKRPSKGWRVTRMESAGSDTRKTFCCRSRPMDWSDFASKPGISLPNWRDARRNLTLRCRLRQSWPNTFRAWPMRNMPAKSPSTVLQKPKRPATGTKRWC